MPVAWGFAGMGTGGEGGGGAAGQLQVGRWAREAEQRLGGPEAQLTRKRQRSKGAAEGDRMIG